MAEPITTAIVAKKIAVKLGTDKRTWKVVGSIIVGFIAIFVLPLLMITTIFIGETEQNRNIANIVFEYADIPSEFSETERNFVIKMQADFHKIDSKIEEIKEILISEEDKNSFDDTRVKAVFYVLYKTSDTSSLSEDFYYEFVNCFINGDILDTDLTNVYTKVSTQTGIEIDDEIKKEINDLYNYIKYGFVTNGSATYDIPADALNDETFKALINEATKYIGMAYVFGGSTPSEGFDCSGYICWVYTKSGVYNLPRTTAQGIFNQCTPVSKEEAKAGDLVFFTKTYNCPDVVTHVGIYVGNGKMLHCGDPINYADVDSNYWKKHFYSYARLSR